MYPFLQLENQIKKSLSDINLPSTILKAPSVKDVDWTIDIKGIFDLNKTRFSNIKQLSDFVYDRLSALDNKYIDQILKQGIFVNILVSPDYVKDILSYVPQGKILDKFLNIKAVVDYSSPNIAKQMSMGHFRATILGEVFSNILESLDAEVIRRNYLGDWGTPFGKLIYSYKYFLETLENPSKVEGLSEDVKEKARQIGIGKKFIENFQKDPIEILGKLYAFFKDIPDEDKDEKARYYFKLLSDGEKEYVDLWQQFRQISIKEFEKVYEILGVQFDLYEGESFAEKYVPQIIEDLEKSGYLLTSKGAKIVVFKKTKEGYRPLKASEVDFEQIDDKDYEILLIQKKDGTTLYATRDLAMIWYRAQKIGAKKIYYVVGKEQSLHFQLVFSLAEVLGYAKKEDLIHIPFGLLLIGGKKMSSRKGDVVRVKDVIELVKNKILQDYGDRIDENIALKLAVASIIVNDLKNDPIKDVNFDINKMTQLQGDTGIYLIYTYLRLKNLIKKIDLSLPDSYEPDMSLLTDEEKSMVKNLEKVVYYYILSYQQAKPNFIMSWLFDFMKGFNSRYSNTEKIINLSEDQKKAKLYMLYAIKKYLDIVFTTFKLPIDVERI